MLKSKDPRQPKEIATGAVGDLPALVMHRDCPFTSPAEPLWKQAAEQEGKSLRVLFSDTTEGERMIRTLDIRGVPCLAAASDRFQYGMVSPEEARAFLRR